MHLRSACVILVLVAVPSSTLGCSSSDPTQEAEEARPAPSVGGEEQPPSTGEGSGTIAYIDGGIWALVDHPEPVFWNGMVYFRWSDGSWFQAPSLDDAWTPADRLPAALRRMERPLDYVHYAPPEGARRAPAP